METFLLLAVGLGFIVLVWSAVGGSRGGAVAPDASPREPAHDVGSLLLIIILVSVAVYLMQQIPQ